MSDPASVQLVLGAYGGIGAALVQQLAERGDRVVCAGRDVERNEAVAAHHGATAHPVDPTDLDAVDALCRQIVEVEGRLDGIACCIGSLLLKPAHLTSRTDWETTLTTNLGSAFAAVRAAGKTMRQGGSVVLVSSSAARIGLANHEAIAAAKAGIIGLTLSAATTYGARGLRFNAVAPGLVRTPMTERITGNPTAVQASANLHAVGRIGEPEEVARMIAWLLDPQQSWVTGQVFGIDGGLGTTKSQRAKG